MAKRPYEPVMHCMKKEYKKVFALGTRVNKGLGANSGIFINPDPLLSVLGPAVALLGTYTGAAKTGDHTAVATLHKQSELVYGYLSSEKAYVKKIANGDKTTILLSGFDSCEEAGPKVIPSKVIIKQVKEGPVTNSAKIMLASVTKTTTPTARTASSVAKGNMFIVDMSTTPNDLNSYHDVLMETNSKKLVIPNLVPDVPVWFRVAARNSKGQGPWSEPFKFIPR
jgi:hypothetical protein